MWRFFLDTLPHRLNLSSRGLDIDSIMYPLCNNNVESNAHVFYSCDNASNIWNLVRGWRDAKFPLLSSYEDWDSWFLHWHASNDAKVQAYCSRCERLHLYTLFQIFPYRRFVQFGADQDCYCGAVDYRRKLGVKPNMLALKLVASQVAINSPKYKEFFL
ncbi:RNA-directed DNA polymerase, eukaryota [Tanacetum coccineum]